MLVVMAAVECKHQLTICTAAAAAAAVVDDFCSKKQANPLQASRS